MLFYFLFTDLFVYQKLILERTALFEIEVSDFV
jgi:hypothetical protein